MRQNADDTPSLAETSRACVRALAADFEALEHGIEGIARRPALANGEHSVGDDIGAFDEDGDIEVDLDDDRFDIVDNEIRLKIGEERAFDGAFWIFVTATAYAPNGEVVEELIALTACDLDWLCQRDPNRRIETDAISDDVIRLPAASASMGVPEERWEPTYAPAGSAVWSARTEPADGGV